MKLVLDHTENNVRLVKDTVSKKVSVAMDAREALAAFIAQVVQTVNMQASTTAGLYTDLEFDQNTQASIPLDVYYNEDAGLFSVWSQNMAGGLPSNFVHDVSELKVQTYSLDSAISWGRKHAEAARLNVIAKYLQRLANTIMIKQDFNAWTVVFKALANAVTLNKKHVIRSNTAGIFLLDDLNKLLTRARRINASYNNGTPDPMNGRGITDLIVSPEIMEQVRAFVYEPLNTRNGATVTSGATSIAAPESLREAVYQNAGVQSLFGLSLHELNEFGVGYAYNDLFDRLAGATTYAKADGSNAAAFDASASQLIVGLDASREVLVRPVEVDSDTRGQYTVTPDDQYPVRAEKQGYVVKVEEGRVCVDARPLTGLIV